MVGTPVGTPCSSERRREDHAHLAREPPEAPKSAADTVASLVEQFVHRKLRAERWDTDAGRWVRDSRANIKARKRPREAAALLGYHDDAAATPARKRRARRKPVATVVSELGNLKARDVTRRQ